MNEIQFNYGVSARTNVKATIWDSQGRRWNGTAMVSAASLAASAWATGLVPLVEVLTADGTATGIYFGDLPETLDASQEYTILFCDSAAPAPTTACLGRQVWTSLDQPSGSKSGGSPPPADAGRPASVPEQLLLIKAQALTRIAELTARPKPSYNIDGQSVSWTQHLAQLQETVRWCDEQLAAAKPVEIASAGYT